MADTAVDYLIMLLSTDWFFDHWDLIGLAVPERARSTAQQGCRELVRCMIDGADEYWLISFAPERITETRGQLFTLVTKCHFDQSALDRINELATDPQSSTMDEKDAWFLGALNNRLIGREEPDETKPSAAVITKIELAWNQTAAPPIPLKKLNLQSDSEWDRYIRSLARDLPTFLSDHVSSLISLDHFLQFWTQVRERLTASERKELLAWYARAGSALKEEEFLVPPWLSK